MKPKKMKVGDRVKVKNMFIGAISSFFDFSDDFYFVNIGDEIRGYRRKELRLIPTRKPKFEATKLNGPKCKFTVKPELCCFDCADECSSHFEHLHCKDCKIKNPGR